MPGLIVRSSMPLDAETPVEAFDRFLTPNNLFFVRSHFGPPATTLAPWRFEVDGLVDRPVALDLDDLRTRYETVTVPAVLQCSGNGRAYYQPTIAGVGWDRGAVGNAEWTGVRLADLLKPPGSSPTPPTSSSTAPTCRRTPRRPPSSGASRWPAPSTSGRSWRPR